MDWRQVFKKSTIYPLVLIALMYVVYKCRQSEAENMHAFTGETMGTYYSVKYVHDGKFTIQPSVDSLLNNFLQIASTYEPESEISRFNRTDSAMAISPMFYKLLKKSEAIYEATDGTFDPTIMPLVNLWGFGWQEDKKGQVPDSLQVDSLRQLVGFKKIVYTKDSIFKQTPGIQLDFSAIAKGYAVDLLHEFLSEKGVPNHMVDIGGEVYCSGTKPGEKPWKMGIEKPVTDERSIQNAITLVDKAMATSGNYRNYYDKDGVRYAHTLNPETGYPIQRAVLSATIVTADCATADGFATAMMVMGLKKGRILVQERDDLEAYLIYKNNEGLMSTWYSDGLKDDIDNK